MSTGFLKKIFWIICLGFTLRACVLEPVRSSDDSMAPQVMSGDIVIVSKLAYGIRMPGAGSTVVQWHPIRRGDLVVAAGIGDPPLSLLRRVTGIPGDIVQVPEEKLPHTLGFGEYFLSADQKSGAMDSHEIGIVLRRTIIGKAEYVWWPGESSSTAAQTQVKSEGQIRRILQPIL